MGWRKWQGSFSYSDVRCPWIEPVRDGNWRRKRSISQRKGNNQVSKIYLRIYTLQSGLPDRRLSILGRRWRPLTDIQRRLDSSLTDKQTGDFGVRRRTLGLPVTNRQGRIGDFFSMHLITGLCGQFTTCVSIHAIVTILSAQHSNTLMCVNHRHVSIYAIGTVLCAQHSNTTMCVIHEHVCQTNSSNNYDSHWTAQ